MNGNLKVIEFLHKEQLISDGFLSVLADIAVRQAAKNLEVELGYEIDVNALKKEILVEVYRK